MCVGGMGVGGVREGKKEGWKEERGKLEMVKKTDLAAIKAIIRCFMWTGSYEVDSGLVISLSVTA